MPGCFADQLYPAALVASQVPLPTTVVPPDAKVVVVNTLSGGYSFMLIEGGSLVVLLSPNRVSNWGLFGLPGLEVYFRRWVYRNCRCSVGKCPPNRRSRYW